MQRRLQPQANCTDECSKYVGFGNRRSFLQSWSVRRLVFRRQEQPLKDVIA